MPETRKPFSCLCRLILQHSPQIQGEKIHGWRCYRVVATDSPMGETFWTAQTRFYVGHLHPFHSSSSPPPCDVVHCLCHLLLLGLCSPWMEDQGRCCSRCLRCRQWWKKNWSIPRTSLEKGSYPWGHIYRFELLFVHQTGQNSRHSSYPSSDGKQRHLTLVPPWPWVVVGGASQEGAVWCSGRSGDG